MLEAHNISIKAQRTTLLKNADLNLQCGEFAVILGPNGAGKSTFLKALCGDVPLSQGQVTYQNRCLSDFNDKELAKMRAVLTQNYDCEFPFNVREIVNMSHYVHDDSYSFEQLMAYSQEAMDTLNIKHLENQSFTQLSGGEKQRVQFARVLCQLLPILKKKQPCYLLIDEPTASLDLYHQYQVMKLAKKIANQGAGVLAVIHDLALAASFADKIYMLEKGSLVAAGAPQQVLSEAQLAHTYQIDAYLSQHDNYLPSLHVSNNHL